jgi:hypothetical protein
MAIQALLNKTDPTLLVNKNNSNYYALGHMNSYNIIVACLPLDIYSTNIASIVASNIKRSF